MLTGHLLAVVQGFEVRLEVGLSAEDTSALWTGMDFCIARVLLLPVYEEGAPALEDPAAVMAQEEIFARRSFPVFLMHYSSVTLQVIRSYSTLKAEPHSSHKWLLTLSRMDFCIARVLLLPVSVE